MSSPRIRVVVINWNSAWFTRRCLRALLATDYPSEALEIVVVDNASFDGSLERIRFEFPDVRIVANAENLGFAEGCNRAMRDLDGIDHVALVNNDAVVDPGWLWPLVEQLEGRPDAGAAAAKLVLEPAFTSLHLEVLGGHAVIDSIRLDGIEVLDRARSDGLRGVGRPQWPMDEVQHLDAAAEVLVPAGALAARITVTASGTGTLVARTGAGEATAPLSSQQRSTLDLAAGDDRVELLNGLGTELGADCEGRDRHFGRPVADLDEPAGLVVPGFCGGGVLLRSQMIEEVGLFDPEFFAYYEDTDLSWRARRAGWKSVTAPDSVIRHAFGGSAGSKAKGFFFLNYRNWILTVARNADREERRRALRSMVDRIKWALRANVLSALRHRRRPSWVLLGAWSRVLVGALATALRRDAGEPVGSEPTERVRSRLQPSPTPRPPTRRPGGPLLVYVVLSESPGVLDVIRHLGALHDGVDVIAVVDHGLSTRRRATAAEWGHLLGVHSSSRPTAGELLALETLEPDCALVETHGDSLCVRRTDGSVVAEVGGGAQAVARVLGRHFALAADTG